VENLKLDSGSRRIERASIVFRPAINRVYRHGLLLASNDFAKLERKRRGPMSTQMTHPL
jgi:hypothetical protein